MPIDRFRGEQPNVDLHLIEEDDHGPVAVAVEAKAAEPCGDTPFDQHRKGA